MKVIPFSARGRKNFARRGGLAALAAAVAAGTALSASAATSNITTGGPIDLLMGVGSSADARNFTWYVPSNAAQSLEIEKKSDQATAGTFDSKSTVVAATSTANTAVDTSTTDAKTKTIPGIANQSGYYNAKARITGLASNTTYEYHVGAKDGSSWSATYEFTTPDFSTSTFDFDFFGDPQIGSSGYPDDDAAGWAATLQYATTKDPSTELLVSGGDQVENANNEYQWSAFADSSSVLKTVPWASTIGNHDVGGLAYQQHNDVPNNSAWPELYKSGVNNGTDSGGDYWFIYKNTLFIDINSNAYAGSSDAEHVSYITDIVNRYGSKAKWKVLVYHHSIYSPADHANDLDNQKRRADFTTAFSALGINLVLQGHDHSYSRSYAILNGAKANPDETAGQPEVYSGPGGVIYVTANSASGSKYYPLSAPDSGQGGYGADPSDSLDPNYSGDTLRHWANSVEDQEYVRTYTQVSVTDDKLDVKTIRANDCTDTTTNSAVMHQTTDIKNACGSPGVGKNPIDGTVFTAPSVAAGTYVDSFKLDRKQPASSTALALSATSTTAGLPVTAKATVTGGIGTPVGTVGFYDGATLLGSVPLVAGAASLSLPASLGVGSHSITAKFTSSSVFVSGDSASSATSLAVVAPPLPTATPTAPTPPTSTPSATAPLTITLQSKAKVSGKAKVGKKLTAINPVCPVDGVTFSYQWLRSGKAIGGAKARTYKLTSADKGKKISVRVTVSKVGYVNAVSTSAATAKVKK